MFLRLSLCWALLSGLKVWRNGCLANLFCSSKAVSRCSLSPWITVSDHSLSGSIVKQVTRSSFASYVRSPRCHMLNIIRLWSCFYSSKRCILLQGRRRWRVKEERNFTTGYFSSTSSIHYFIWNHVHNLWNALEKISKCGLSNMNGNCPILEPGKIS